MPTQMSSHSRSTIWEPAALERWTRNKASAARGSIWQRGKTRPLRAAMGTGGPNKLVEAGYLSRPPVIVAYLTQANDIHRISGALAPTRGSTVPILAALSLHRVAGGIADLDPDRAPTGSVSPVDPPCDDCLRAKRACTSSG